MFARHYYGAHFFAPRWFPQSKGASPISALASFVIEAYRYALTYVGEPANIVIRRYSGIGAGRTFADTPITARVMAANVAGKHDQPIVGALVEGSQRVIALAQDLVDAGFSLPLRSTDKVVIEGKENAITGLDDKTRAIAGVLIAYDLIVKG